MKREMGAGERIPSGFCESEAKLESVETGELVSFGRAGVERRQRYKSSEKMSKTVKRRARRRDEERSYSFDQQQHSRWPRKAPRKKER